jgi:hypothetical protein
MLLKILFAVVIFFILFGAFFTKESYASKQSALSDKFYRQSGAVQTSSSPLFSQSSRELNIDGRNPANVSLPYSYRLPPYSADLYPAAVDAFTVSSNAWEFDKYGLNY